MAAKVTFLPDNKTLEARPGTTLLDAARRARVHIRTRCGGKAACLMCKVRVTENAGTGLAEPNRNEALKLGGLQQEGYRLACQAKITGPVTVLVPEDPLKSAIRKQLEKQEEEW
ncbi:2Fe-2S iron-sulfur cluster-binding protein [Paenibacillus sp. MZ04-78.2]|uniref:2Fe-2S iron-sulfur cluster-binding protein n=1 Tax=Paenibacillus sp. MZ04-78.2 TaxID=2962034 RepID=UPI0020B7126F|nr:2Fe-2S iron-sulfur cluster-binding protein [Paenibacillus sp. MZ04-78.2]MCP3772463.1 2Fe-2S iron-sulfur cluster-binding protein [Paenibacillus sp. MZ04-78.2]